MCGLYPIQSPQDLWLNCSKYVFVLLERTKHCKFWSTSTPKKVFKIVKLISNARFYSFFHIFKMKDHFLFYHISFEVDFLVNFSMKLFAPVHSVINGSQNKIFLNKCKDWYRTMVNQKIRQCGCLSYFFSLIKITSNRLCSITSFICIRSFILFNERVFLLSDLKTTRFVTTAHGNVQNMTSKLFNFSLFFLFITKWCGCNCKKKEIF